MSTLSVIIITKNEEKNIRRCLESVKWADEIIVFDSGSTDQTIAICKEYTKHIFVTDWPGFGPQKNRALEKASSDWVLSIDADEQLTEELIIELRIIMRRSEYAGYYIKRCTNYCGQFIRYGDWKKDQVLRLFHRDQSKFTDDIIHEKVIVQGQVAVLKEKMLHFSFSNFSEVINKVNLYSTYGAELKCQQGKTSNMMTVIMRSLWCFFRGYFLRLGFLDGKNGFLLAVSNMLGVFYRYVKLSYLYQHLKISVIVTTYNRPDTLKMVLDALSEQSDQHFEVIVADDGSGPETRQLVQDYQKKSNYILKHVWQPDEGFRAAKIRNKGIQTAEGEYIIFLDGDCVPVCEFVSQHRCLAEPGWFIAGKRLLLSPAYTKEVLTHNKQLQHITFQKAISLRVTGKINRFLTLLHFPLGPFRKMYPRQVAGVKTCNMGVWKKNLLEVNGFDESYEGWGYEDTDLVVRLIHAGLKRKSGRFSAMVWHLWHPEADRSQSQKNLDRLKLLEKWVYDSKK